MSFESDFILAEIKKLSEEDFKYWNTIFLDQVLNTKIDEEHIRVPLIGKYLKFHPFSYDDYLLLLKNNIDLKSDRNKIFEYCEIEMDLHFKDFVHEYGRKNSGIIKLVDEDFLIPLTDTSLHLFIPLVTREFTSLLQVKNHLQLRISERFNLIKKQLDLKSLQIDMFFCIPQSIYAMNKNTMKLILELTF